MFRQIPFGFETEIALATGVRPQIRVRPDVFLQHGRLFAPDAAFLAHVTSSTAATDVRVLFRRLVAAGKDSDTFRLLRCRTAGRRPGRLLLFHTVDFRNRRSRAFRFLLIDFQFQVGRCGPVPVGPVRRMSQNHPPVIRRLGCGRRGRALSRVVKGHRLNWTGSFWRPRLPLRVHGQFGMVRDVHGLGPGQAAKIDFGGTFQTQIGVGVAVEIQLAEKFARTRRLWTDERRARPGHAQHVGLAALIQAGHIGLFQTKSSRLQRKRIGTQEFRRWSRRVVVIESAVRPFFRAGNRMHRNRRKRT